MFFKVCGMRRQQDLDLASRLGFALCGFIFHPKSPRGITPEAAAALESRDLRRTGVFVRQTARETLAICKTARLDFIQLHGDQDETCLRDLASAVGRDHLIRVLWPQRWERREDFQAEVDKVAEYCGMILLDAGKQGGGHGLRLDLPSLSGIHFPVPWILAGGMSADALRDFATWPEATRPAGLDFNSRLESNPGEKDHALMAGLVEQARALGLPPMPLA